MSLLHHSECVEVSLCCLKVLGQQRCHRRRVGPQEWAAQAQRWGPKGIRAQRYKECGSFTGGGAVLRSSLPEPCPSLGLLFLDSLETSSLVPAKLMLPDAYQIPLLHSSHSFKDVDHLNPLELNLCWKMLDQNLCSHLITTPGLLHDAALSENITPAPALFLVNSSHSSSLSPTKTPPHVSAELWCCGTFALTFVLTGLLRLPLPRLTGCQLHRDGILSVFLPKQSPQIWGPA